MKILVISIKIKNKKKEEEKKKGEAIIFLHTFSPFFLWFVLNHKLISKLMKLSVGLSIFSTHTDPDPQFFFF